ncbi:MAG: C4-dicarboxylate TRAP transporter substrate-binding protein [Alphaproteobacteria bacterium]
MTRLRRIAIGIGFGALVAGITLPGANAIEIRTGVSIGPKHPGVSHGYVPFMEAVEKASNGDIKFRFFPGGQLFGHQNALEGVKNRIADMGFLVVQYWPAQFPHGKLLGDLGMLGTDPRAMAGATTEFNLLHCSDCLAEYDRNGVVYQGGYSTAVYQILSRMPIRNAEELKGKKIRTPGGGWTRWVQQFGAVPVAFPGDQMYEGFSQKVLDATIVSVATLQAYAMYDVASDVTNIPLGTFHSLTLIGFNREFWQKDLKAAQRKLLMDHSAMAIARSTLRYMEQDDEVVPIAKEKGIRFHQPDAAFLKAAEDFALADVDVTVKDVSTAASRTRAPRPIPILP